MKILNKEINVPILKTSSTVNCLYSGYIKGSDSLIFSSDLSVHVIHNVRPILGVCNITRLYDNV